MNQGERSSAMAKFHIPSILATICLVHHVSGLGENIIIVDLSHYLS